MSIFDLIKSRRTIRKFQSKQISDEQLLKYVDAARVAPSGANLQPLKYVIVKTPEMVDKVFNHVKWAGYLAPGYNPKENERPTAFIIVLGDKSIRESGYDMDVGAAVENIILTALEDKVGACWMGAIDREEIGKLIDLTEGYKISCVVALGYSMESPKEVEISDGIKYYLDENGTLCVPKRSIDEVLIKQI